MTGERTVVLRLLKHKVLEYICSVILVTAAVGLSVTSVGLFPSSHPSLPTSVRPSLVSSLYGSASRYG